MRSKSYETSFWQSITGPINDVNRVYGYHLINWCINFWDEIWINVDNRFDFALRV